MKAKKIFLIGLILLAILSIGAVSASADIASSDAGSLSDADDDGWDDEDFEDDEDEYWDDDDDFWDGTWDENAYNIDIDEDLSHVYYMENPVIASLTLPKDAYGNLTAFDGDYETGDYLGEFPLVNGYAEVKMHDLVFEDEEDFLGDHIIYLVYEGDDYSVNDAEMVISIVDYELTGPTNINLAETATYTLDLHRDLNGTLYVSPSLFNGEEYIEGEAVYFDIINGKAKATFPNLNMGMYLLTFTVSEVDYAIIREVYLDVFPKINVKNRITIGKDDIISVDLPKDAAGSFSLSLYSEALDDYIDVDMTYKNGNLKVPSIGLASGDYEIAGFEINDKKYGHINLEDTSTFCSGDGVYATFKAVYPTTSAIVASNFKAVYSAGSIYKVRITLDGKAASGARVVFKINNVEVKTTTADKNGYATLKITQIPGTYKITTVALGKTVTKKLTVNHILTLKKVTVKKSATSLVLQANLAKVNGKYLKKKMVNFKFNGVKYSVKTDSKGIAKVTIDSKVLKKIKGKSVTYQASYMKDTVKLTVKVKN